MAVAPRRRFARRHPAWTALGLALAVLLLALALLLTHLQWLRGPLQRLLSSQLQREVHIGHIDLRWGREPTLRLDDLRVGNAPGSQDAQMASLRAVEARWSPGALLRGKVDVPRVAVTEADVLLERFADGRKNWVLGQQHDDDTKPPKPQEPPRWLRVGGVSIDRGHFRFRDHRLPLEVTVDALPLDAQAEARSESAKAAPVHHRDALRYEIGGHYRGNVFSGTAHSGNVISLQDSGQPFPVRMDITAGQTRVQMEGTVADVAELSGVDTRLRIAGPTLANLYPFLLLPLPATPPYALHGRLRRDGPRFAIEEIGGHIGSTDLRGEGSYVNRPPRPLLQVHLRSDLLDITDLGPMIGVQTASRGDKPASQGETSDRESAKASDDRTRGHRVLPSGRFDPARLRLIDADATLRAQRVKGVAALPLEGFNATLKLHDAVLQLDPLQLGIAGGNVTSRATLDARQGETLHAKLQTEASGLQLDRLVPDLPRLAQGSSDIGAAIALGGSGNSIADVAARADGRLSLRLSPGRISNLLDAASGVNLGRVLRLLATGDKEIALNCGAVVFDVHQGQGRSSVFVVDTAQTQVLGSGHIDLAQERFDLRIEPKPKVKGLLSLRTPARVEGSFSDVKVNVEKTPLLAKAGAALALGAVAPIAAVLPLIETGPGASTPCTEVMRQAQGAPADGKSPVR